MHIIFPLSFLGHQIENLNFIHFLSFSNYSKYFFCDLSAVSQLVQLSHLKPFSPVLFIEGILSARLLNAGT